MTNPSEGFENISDAALASLFKARAASGAGTFRPLALWVPADRQNEFVERITRIVAEDASLSPTVISTQINKRMVEQYPDLSEKCPSSIKLIEALTFRHPALEACRENFIFVFVKGSNEYPDPTTGETVRHLPVPVLNRLCHLTI